MKKTRTLSVLALAVLLMFSLAACSGAPKATTGVTFDIPDGFELYTETPEVYAVADGSTINVVVGAKDANFSSYTKEDLENEVGALFVQVYGDGTEYTVNAFDFTEIDGVPALIAKATISLGTASLQQTQVMLNADKTYTVTYTDMTGNWDSDFSSSVSSIKLTY